MPEPDNSVSELDALLAAYLETADEGRADSLLGVLLNEHARPLVHRIVGSKLGRVSGVRLARDAGQDAEDVTSEVLIGLLKRLRRWRSQRGSAGIALNLSNYIAVAAYNGFYGYLRRKYPERNRIKESLSRALKAEHGLATWSDSGRSAVCGYLAWQDEGRQPLTKADLYQLVEGERRSTLVAASAESRKTIGGLVRSVLDSLAQPVELDDLVTLTSALLSGGPMGFEPPRPAMTAVNGDGHRAAASEGGAWAFASGVEKRLYLGRLWKEITLLPSNQRAALLLGLADGPGGEMLTIFVHTRIASLRQVAETVGTPPERMAELCRELPMDDAAIASILGVSRQQVINLRASARKRLSRRMGGRSL